MSYSEEVHILHIGTSTVTESLESSLALESHALFYFTVREKHISLTPMNADGVQTIFDEEDCPPIIGEFDVKFSDLLVFDTTENHILDMVSSFHTIPESFYEDLKQKISARACQAAKVAFEERATLLRINVKVEVQIREEYEDDDGIEAESMEIDEEPSFPASRSSVEALETIKYDNGESGGTCVVCMDEFLIGVEVTRMPCSHIFHGGCILEWLEKRNSCPLCRFEMPTEP